MVFTCRYLDLSVPKGHSGEAYSNECFYVTEWSVQASTADDCNCNYTLVNLKSVGGGIRRVVIGCLVR